MKFVYGGAFDPITRAHLEIIKTIQKVRKENDEFFVLISNNDEKEYKTSLDDRFSVVKATFLDVFKDKAPAIIEQDKRTFMFLKEHFAQQDEEITIVVGQDEWHALLEGKWVHHKELLKTYNFIVIARESDEERKPHDIFIKDVTYLKIKNMTEVSSSKVREIFYRNPNTQYKEVHDHLVPATYHAVLNERLYNQNGPDYAQEEQEFLVKYAKQKEENHWGEPSVTTDIVAHNGDKILLIRRKKPPFKNYWALPGGFFEPDDADLCDGAAREFREETTISLPSDKFVQIKAYGHNFDPRMKICDVAFSVRVNAKDMKKAVGADDAAEAKWFDINDLPVLAFHHAQIIEDFKKTKED